VFLKQSLLLLLLFYYIDITAKTSRCNQKFRIKALGLGHWEDSLLPILDKLVSEYKIPQNKIDVQF